MRNPVRLLRELLPEAPLLVGDVIEYADGVAVIEEPGGGRNQARGVAVVGDRVFFRDGLIEGPAPALPIQIIEV